MKLTKTILAAAAVFSAAIPGHAQYYELASALPKLISPALSGSASYKGFVEVTGLGGVGTNRANFIGLATSQGFQYKSWFYMGAGLGIDVAMARNNPEVALDRHVNTMAMIPVFTDFRFNIPAGTSGTSFYIDAKLGAAWFLGKNYLNLYSGTISHNGQFFLQPSIGVRIPVNSSNSRQAVNFGITYRLLTSNNNYYYYTNSGTPSLNSFGATISFEW